MKGETPETKRENITDWPGSDARSSVGKHASGRPRSEFGEPQMQRKVRSQQVASPAVGTGRRKAEGFGQKRYGKPETAKRSCGHGTARWKGTDKSACRGDQNQPPDGTGRQHGNQAMKAGPNGPPSSRKCGRSNRKGRTKQLESSLGYGDRPSRPEPEQASVGLVETPAPFAVGACSAWPWLGCARLWLLDFHRAKTRRHEGAVFAGKQLSIPHNPTTETSSSEIRLRRGMASSCLRVFARCKSQLADPKLRHRITAQTNSPAPHGSTSGTGRLGAVP